MSATNSGDPSMNEPARSTSSVPPESFGRYLLYPAIARGGMATVHTARLVGAEGFTRLVAAKRLHPHFTDDPDFVTMFHDEACIASRIHHPNVVPVLDVVVAGNELILVQEYVHGVPLGQLLKLAQVNDAPLPVDIVIAVLTGVLAGLHAAHEVRDESDALLEIVHRDVSPQNVMVSVDGIPRLLDFGIAKARTSTHHTREGVFKGKLAYMAPEQLRMDSIDRTVDIYATGVLAWEMLVNRRIYDGRHEMAFVTAVMAGEIPSITEAIAKKRETTDPKRWKDIVALEAIVSRAMSLDSSERYATADEMLRALLEVRPSATSMAVAEWVRSSGADFLDQRQKMLTANEESWRRSNLYTPTSGTQRTSGSVVASFPLPAPGEQLEPSATAVIPGTRTSLPPSVTFPSRAPTESGAYRVALGVSPLARAASSMRGSTLLPWAAAFAFVVAGLVGGFMRAGTDAATAASIVQQPMALPVPPPVATGGGTTPDVALTIATAQVVPANQLPQAQALQPAAPPLQQVQRQYHFVPAPRPVAPRAAPPPPVSTTSTSTSTAAAAASAKVDCNPPFFFEGTKKVFKPSCL
jgi:serine/threonine-protein kinase